MIVAVLDTNVLVSGLCLPQSLPADILRRWLAREFLLVLSETILMELADVLRRPKIVTRFAMTEEKAAVFLDVLRELASLVPVTLDLAAVPDDPKDNHVVACAVEGGAGFLVSGDHHLTGLEQYQGVRILSPAHFRAFLLEAQDEEKPEKTPG